MNGNDHPPRQWSQTPQSNWNQAQAPQPPVSNWGSQPQQTVNGGWGTNNTGTNWNTPNNGNNGPSSTNWNNHASHTRRPSYVPEREDVMWNSSPGYNSSPNNPVNRIVHSRNNSWSVNQPQSRPPADNWDNVPGFTTTAAQNPPPQTSQWGANPQPFPVDNFSKPQFSGWTPPEHLAQRQQPLWNAPKPSYTPPVIAPNPTVGWDSRPPANDSPAKWDGQKPSGVILQPSTIPPSHVTPPTSVAGSNSGVVIDRSVKVEDPILRVSTPPSGVTGIVKGRPQVNQLAQPDSDTKPELKKARSISALNQQLKAEPRPTGSSSPNGAVGMWKKADPVKAKDVEQFKELRPTSARLFSAVVVSDPKKKAMGVYVYGFPAWVRVPEIIEIFKSYGTILNVGLVAKPKQKERIHAYVEYEVAGCAAAAVEALQSKLFFEMSTPLELKLHYEEPEADVAQPTPSRINSPALGLSASPSRISSPAPQIISSPPSRVGSPAPSSNPPSRVTSPAMNLSSNLGHRRDKSSISLKNIKELAKKEHHPEELDLKSLHIANVPQNIDKNEVEKAFSAYGELKRIHVVQRPKEKRSFAFITYREDAGAKKALHAIRTTKFFGMKELLKAEHSKIVKAAEKKPATTNGTTAVDKLDKWNKGEGLKQMEANDKKKDEKKKEKKTPAAQKKETPTVIYIAQISDSEKDWHKGFEPFGTPKSYHIVSRMFISNVGIVTPGESEGTESVVLSNHGVTFGLVSYADPEEAAKAVNEKLLNGVFPRQRRVIVSGFDENATEEDIRAWFSTAGEVRKVEKHDVLTEAVKLGATVVDEAAVKKQLWWLVEFMRPDGAARALIKSLEEKLPGLDVKVHAEYAPSARIVKKAKPADDKKGEDTVDDGHDDIEVEAVPLASLEENHEDNHDEEYDSSDDEKMIQAELDHLKNVKISEKKSEVAEVKEE
ncbi:hypothetical protein HK098_003614 [Nowakowskiella sp. JEL0407]|nr:hypothetical protein HK098_003614 [Nowakowskiella sp. JEL0407]